MPLSYLDPGSSSVLLQAFIGVLLWAIPALLVAKLAQLKGHGFGSYLFIGLALTWVVSLLTLGVALLVESHRAEAAARSDSTPS